MSVFLGHHRNIDRVENGTKNETLRQLFRTRSLASHTQVLSEPCNKLCNRREATLWACRNEWIRKRGGADSISRPGGR
uniref:Uncharacterized protein n=1 Tax=Brassica campestris TaxID=3711 RepID=A0A3P6DYF2_BRACM|nr:unnamed protein product [Brassica rapa]